MGRLRFKFSTSAAEFFNLGTMFAHLKHSGKEPIINESLMTCVMIGNNSPIHFFMNEVGIGSSSHVVEEVVMNFATSSSVTDLNWLIDEVASSSNCE